MNIKTLVVGTVRANCYFIWNDAACVLIDPGDDFERIETILEQLGKPLEAILLTHGHFDHVGAVKELKARYPQVPVMVGEADEELLREPERVYKGMLSQIPDKLHLEADRLLEDGEEINISGMSFTVIATPGHTKGSVCYLYENAVFSGDTLFRGTCGRCDFYGGDSRAMGASLKKLAALEGDRLVYPGHEGETSLEQERKYNRFMGQ
ncbi:MAG: MBL fold metallo-hydrolase [Oscillospiraceae bacterium]|nr:MBL fold metallo-hydrolase [Oscillospiraceae bacterium]